MQLNRRASVSVEMALVSVFILFPLLAGLADFLFIVAAKYQLNGALAALYAYAWNNPASAASTTQLQTVLANINQHSLPQVALSSAATYTICTTAAPVQCSAAASIPQWGVSGQSITVTYNIVSNVPLPVPMPFGFSAPFTVSSSGSVQLQ